MKIETSKSNELILVKKASGEEEVFSTGKLKQSLMNAGAEADTVKKIVADIESWIFPGVTTKKIYARAFSILHLEKAHTALRYKLKQAIFEIGPTGYPFETLIGQLFAQRGYQTEVGIVVDGVCVTHEMDVIATKAQEQHLVECKYHKDQGKQVSIQVPLYVKSRIDDIVDNRQRMPEYKGFSFTGWVITNTRFSPDSIDYGKCKGMNLLGWDHPSGQGLKELIEKYKLYPVTILHALNKKEKQYLLEQGVVTCSQLLKNPDIMQVFDWKPPKMNGIMNELRSVCP